MHASSLIETRFIVLYSPWLIGIRKPIAVNQPAHTLINISKQIDKQVVSYDLLLQAPKNNL